eukprot:4072871-Prymnesium_polylepis.1
MAVGTLRLRRLRCPDWARATAAAVRATFGLRPRGRGRRRAAAERDGGARAALGGQWSLVAPAVHGAARELAQAAAPTLHQLKRVGGAARGGAAGGARPRGRSPPRVYGARRAAGALLALARPRRDRRRAAGGPAGGGVRYRARRCTCKEGAEP